MSNREKSHALYKSPFSKAYWRDAAAELKDTRMLVFAALMIALRVALKSVSIEIMPQVRINTAFFINALGAMTFGPVVAIVAAAVSDTLGCLLVPTGVYFFPFIFEEIGGSLIFALFLYRAKVTPTRVILSRFCIDFFINIVMNAPIMWLYYKMVLGKSYLMFQLPQILKNLFMFPIESVLLTLFLAAVIPISYRLGLTYDGATSLKFQKRQAALLVALFCVGVGSVTGYLFYYYDTTSLSASYTSQERLDANQSMEEILRSEAADLDGETLVTTVESAYRQFGKGTTTYNVAIYVVDEAALADYDKSLEEIQGMSKSKAAAAAEDGVMTRTGSACVILDNKTSQVLDCSIDRA
jgi:ECF transporter S component (folate family)